MGGLLEFWPDYGGGPLWTSEGATADLGALPLSPGLRLRLADWNGRYTEDRMPFRGNDEAWLAEGRELLAELRANLGDGYEVVVTEPWWGEEPVDP